MDMHHGHGDMRRPAHEAALRAVQKPPAKPWRGGSGAAAAVPAPPKVYRVEPRGFRDLVQRLTGAPARQQQQQHRQAVAQPVPVRAGEEAQFYAAPWCSFPLLSPASMAGLDAHDGNGALM